MLQTSCIVVMDDKKHAVLAVLRALCTNVLPSGHHETLVTKYEGWASIASDVVSCCRHAVRLGSCRRGPSAGQQA